MACIWLATCRKLAVYLVGIWMNSLVFVLVGVESPELYQGLYFLLALVISPWSLFWAGSPLYVKPVSSTCLDPKSSGSSCFCLWCFALGEAPYIRSLNFCSHTWVFGVQEKNKEGSAAAEEEGVPKVNIQILLGFIRGSGHFLGLRRPEWNQEEGLTSSQGGGSDHQKGRPSSLCLPSLFLTVSGALGEASYSCNLMEFIHCGCLRNLRHPPPQW